MNDEQMDRLFARMEVRFKTKEPYWNLKNLALLFTMLTTFSTTLVGAIYSIRNNEKIDLVQTETKEAAAEVKTSLDAATKRQEKSLETIEDSIEPSLRAAWKYAQQIADDSGLVRDKEKAAEAKSLYDEHVAKMRASGKTIK